MRGRDGDGWTALMHARSAAMVSLLVDAGADVDATAPYGRSPLLEALGAGRTEVVRELARRGCDLERRDHGYTPLLGFCVADDIGAASITALLDAGADRHATTSARGETALHLAAQLFSGNRRGKLGAAIRVLVAAGLPVDVRDRDGATPLFAALGSEGGDPGAVRTLLELGASVNARRRGGATPLMTAVTCYRARELVPLLLAAGADPLLAIGRGDTAYDWAVDQHRTWQRITGDDRGEPGESPGERAYRRARHAAQLSEAREVMTALADAMTRRGQAPRPRPERIEEPPPPPPPRPERPADELLAELERVSYDPLLVAELAAAPRLAVAAAGLARYPLTSSGARAALLRALADVADVAPLRPALLSLWAPAPGRDERWYRGFDSLQQVMKTVCRDPGMVELLARDLFAEDAGAAARRATVIELLGCSGSEVAARALVRRFEEDPDARYLIRRAFVELARPEPWEVVLQDLGERPSGWRYGGLEALVACGGARAVPHLLAAAGDDETARAAVPLLLPFADPVVDERLLALCAHPDGEVRVQAALVLVAHRGPAGVQALVGVLATLGEVAFRVLDQAAAALPEHPGDTLAAWQRWLEERGLAPLALPPLPSPLDQLASRCGEARREAMEALHRQRSPAHLLALALAEELDREWSIGFTRTDWDGWSGIVPAAVLADRPRLLRPWIEAEKERLPPQVVPDRLAAALRDAR